MNINVISIDDLILSLETILNGLKTLKIFTIGNSRIDPEAIIRDKGLKVVIKPSKKRDIKSRF